MLIVGAAIRPVAPWPRSILLSDLRRRRDDGAGAVRHQEIAVGDFGGSGIHADEDVHPIMILPQRSDLHSVKVTRPTQDVHHVVGDDSGSLGRLLILLIGGLLLLLFRWHRFPQTVSVKRSAQTR